MKGSPKVNYLRKWWWIGKSISCVYVYTCTCKFTGNIRLKITYQVCLGHMTFLAAVGWTMRQLQKVQRPYCFPSAGGATGCGKNTGMYMHLCICMYVNTFCLEITEPRVIFLICLWTNHWAMTPGQKPISPFPLIGIATYTGSSPDGGVLSLTGFWWHMMYM